MDHSAPFAHDYADAASGATPVVSYTSGNETTLLEPAPRTVPLARLDGLGGASSTARRGAHTTTRRETTPLRIAMVSTYPPTLCGLATFSAALRSAWEDQGHRVDMVQVDDGDQDRRPADRVAGVLAAGSDSSMAAAIRVLDDADLAVVQHEFGIYGGPDGDEVLLLARAVRVPLVVVLHTVPVEPTTHQAEILVELAGLARWSVVMSDAARERLVTGYPQIDPAGVVTIPHGAAVPLWGDSQVGGSAGQTGLLTWGLIGPGKGIEHVIDAIALLRAEGVDVPYTVAGVTHPKVLARDGEAYRDMLRARANERGVADLVTFDSSYRTPAEMTAFVAASGVVVLPYDSHEQVTSGVLVDSIAAGRPVIATRFPHATELLADGAGLVVPHGSPPDLAAAIRAVTTDVQVRRGMTRRARELAPSLSWSSVARRYARLAVPAEARGAGTAA